MIPFFQITIYSYSLCTSIGIFFSLYFLLSRFKRYNIKLEDFALYTGVGLVGLLLGSKFLFAVGSIPKLNNALDISLFFHYLIHGGIVFYGGLLGMLLFIYVTAKFKKEDIDNLFNYFVPAIPLFHFFGRLGCLFSGCCYGIPFKWGVIMRVTPDIVRFPVQLVEACCNLLIFILLIIFEKKNWFKNKLMVYFLLYSFCRFILEFYRGDSVRGVWVLFSTSQMISIAIFISCIIKVIYIKVKKNKIKKVEDIINI